MVRRLIRQFRGEISRTRRGEVARQAVKLRNDNDRTSATENTRRTVRGSSVEIINAKIRLIVQILIVVRVVPAANSISERIANEGARRGHRARSALESPATRLTHRLARTSRKF